MVLGSARLSARVLGATERGGRLNRIIQSVDVCEGGLTAVSPDFLMTLKWNWIFLWNVLASSQPRKLLPVIPTELKVSLTTYSPKKRQTERRVSELPLRYLHFVPLTFAAQGMCGTRRCFHMHQCLAFGSNRSLRCAGTGRILLHHTEKPAKVKHATWTCDVKCTTSSWLFQKREKR